MIIRFLFQIWAAGKKWVTMSYGLQDSAHTHKPKTADSPSVVPASQPNSAIAPSERRRRRDVRAEARLRRGRGHGGQGLRCGRTRRRRRCGAGQGLRFGRATWAAARCAHCRASAPRVPGRLGSGPVAAGNSIERVRRPAPSPCKTR